MKQYRFNELSEQGKKVAVQGFMEDSVSFFDDSDITEEVARKTLEEEDYKHWYDMDGIVVGGTY